MKTNSWFGSALLLLTLPAAAQEQKVASTDVARLPALPATAPEWHAKSRSEHQTEWYSVRYLTNAAKDRVKAVTNSVIELANGLNRRDSLGQWRPASPAFQITANGAEANAAGHRVTLAGNINSAGAVRIEKAGVILQGHPLCVGYYDPADGRSELLAELTDATGWLVASNEVVFSNCFKGIQGSIRYRNTRSGLEQDLLLHAQLPVTPADFGFSERARLELFSEWVGDTPTPEETTRVLEAEKDPAVRQQLREPDFSDTTLNFGVLEMPSGRAFSTAALSASPGGHSRMESVQVGKRFEIIDGRKILIEAVPHSKIRAMLEKLPASSAVGTLTNAAIRSRPKTNDAQFAQAQANALPFLRAGRAAAEMAGVRADNELKTQNAKLEATRSLRPLPARRLAQATAVRRIQTAAVDSTPKRETQNTELAFVLDWQINIVGSLPDYTFLGVSTYLVNGPVSLSGTTTFEGGTVVKYGGWGNNPSLNISGPVVCETSDLEPATFTAIDDDSVGDLIAGSTGTPGGFGYGNPCLAFYGPGVNLKHFRVRYSAGSPLAFFNETTENRVWHSQFVNCWSIWAQNNSLALLNVLFNANGGWAVVEGYGFTVQAEHLTAHSVFLLADDYSGTGHINFVNSLAIDVLGCWAEWSHDHFEWLDYEPPAPVFQTVGAGNHYLADNYYRDVGTPSIDPTLKTELANRTTYPPIVQTETISQNLVLSPRNLGDTGSLDWGYHYPILDYALSRRVDNATVLVTNGVTIATFGLCALWLNGSHLVSEGTPSKLNRFLSYADVQEQAMHWGRSGSQACATFLAYTFYQPGQVRPQIQLRFTSVDCARNVDYHLFVFSEEYAPSRFDLRDCEIRGGTLWYGTESTTPLIIGLTNNVFDGINYLAFGGNPDVYLFNNLFRHCALDLSRYAPATWQIRDNFFYSCDIWDYGDPSQHDHNAYFGCLYDGIAGTGMQMLPVDVSDKVLISSITFEKGPFGKFYLPAAATSLIDQGSRNAGAAGLYHYTTRTTPAKEGDSLVDIGVHYVAATGANQPIDTDNDDLSDYVEDSNGNGLLDSAESSFSNPDTDGDGMWDGWEVAFGFKPDDSTGVNGASGDPDGDGVSNYVEYLQGRHPRNTGTIPDSGGTYIGLKIYTP